MYALVEIKGKQYKAEKGSVIRVDRFSEEAGSKVLVDKVLLVNDDKNVKIGTPYVSGASVKAVVESHTKGDKVIVFKYKKRKNERKKNGHRASYTMIKVEDIVL